MTPYPLVGWTYTDVGGDSDAADGLRIICGEGETDGDGCGVPFYLNFVRFEAGREIEPAPDPDRVTLAHPQQPDRPRTPGGPGR